MELQPGSSEVQPNVPQAITKSEPNEKTERQPFGVPHRLALSGCFYFVSYFGQRSYMALGSIDVYMMDNGYQEDDLMLIRIAQLLPFILKIFIANLNDRWQPPWRGSVLLLSGRRRPVIFYGSVIGILGTILFASFNGSKPTIAGVAGFLFLTQIGLAAADQAIDAHMAELVAPVPPGSMAESLAPFTGRLQSMMNLGASIGYFAGMVAVTQLGPTWSWTGSFWIVAAMGTFTPPSVLFLPDTMGTERAHVQVKPSCRVICADRFMRKVYFFVVLLGIAMGGPLFVTVPLMKREHDISPQEEGYITMCTLVGFALGASIGGVFVDWRGTYIVLVGALALVWPFTIAILLTGRHSGVFWLCLMVGVTALVFAQACAALMAIAVNNAPAEMPGFAICFAFVVFNFGMMIGSTWLIVAKRLSYDAAFIGVSAALLLLFFLGWLLFRNNERTVIKNTTIVPPSAFEPQTMGSANSEPLSRSGSEGAKCESVQIEIDESSNKGAATVHDDHVASGEECQNHITSFGNG